MFKVLRSEDLEVRNYSKRDQLVQEQKLYFKSLWDTAQLVGLTLGLMLGTDELLRGANSPPVFTPFLSQSLNQIFPESALKIKKKNYLQKVFKDQKQIRKNLNKNLMEKFKDL